MLALALAGCEGMEAKPSGVVGSVEGFAGIAVADEPQAVVAARDVLTAGGSAADAAVALYFTLAVTLPSSAGLGGGGVCIVADARNGKTEALEFLPRAVPGGLVGLPGNVRGMAALHSRYGKLEWRDLLAGPVDLALNGAPVSRALAREIATAADKLRADPTLRQAFTRSDGRLVDEGDKLQQLDLAGTLSIIRDRGAGALYTGPLAQRFARATESIGLPISTAAMRSFVPSFHETLQLVDGERILHVPRPPADGGLVEAELLALLTAGRDYRAAPADERPHLFAEASRRALLDRGRWLQAGADAPPADLLSAPHIATAMSDYRPDAATDGVVNAAISPDENPWATGFITADRDGLVVACEMTMNDLFGAGRAAPQTGIILAASPRATGPGDFALGPMIVTNRDNSEIYFAAAASGGPTAITAKVAVLLDMLAGGPSLEEAIAARRIHHNGVPDVVYYEEGESEATLAALRARGHQVAQAGLLGRVDAFWCPQGLPSEPDRCQVGSDPRGDGYAVLQTD